MRLYRSLAAFSGLSLAAACASGPQSAPPSGPAPAKAAAIPAAPVYRLSDILGAAPQRVDALLGAPALTRREGAGEYRRYGLKTCGLIVIIYPDAAGVPKVAHVDATALTSDAQKPDVESCLAAG